MKNRIKKAVLSYAVKKFSRTVDKYFEKNDIFINLFNTGVVIEGKKTVTAIKRILAKKR